MIISIDISHIYDNSIKINNWRLFETNLAFLEGHANLYNWLCLKYSHFNIGNNCSWCSLYFGRLHLDWTNYNQLLKFLLILFWTIQSELVLLWTIQSELVLLWTIRFALVLFWTIRSELVLLWTIRSELVLLWTIRSELVLLWTIRFALVLLWTIRLGWTYYNQFNINHWNLYWFYLGQST